MQRHRCPLFVGRAEELRRLTAALDSARGNDPGVVLVQGEAGAGKSRLIDEFVSVARGSGSRIGIGWCAPTLTPPVPAAPLLAALGDLEDGEEWCRQVRASASRFGDLAELASQALRRGDSRAPRVLIIEDIHWADEATADLLAYLAWNARRGAALILVSFRPEALGRGQAVRALVAELTRLAQDRIDLIGLDRQETRRFIEALGVARPDENVIDIVHCRARVNPFYLEQLIAAGAATGPLPPALYEVLAMQLSELTPACVYLLQVMAMAAEPVYGSFLRRVFDGDLDERLDDALSVVLDAGLVMREPPESFQFRDELLREAVDADMLPARRVRVHRRLAAAYEAGTTGDSGAASRHWELAEDIGLALAASLAAFHAARKQRESPAALDHARRALRLWDRAGSTVTSLDVDHAELLLLAAAAAHDAGLVDQAVHLAADAVRELAAGEDPRRYAAGLERLARYTWAAGDPTEALRLCKEAMAVIAPSGPSPERARILAALAQNLLVNGRPADAVKTGRDALAAARAVADPAVEVGAGITTGGALAELGHAAEAVTQLGRAFSRAGELGLADEQLRSLHNVGAPLLDLGRIDDAIDLTRQGLAIAIGSGLAAAKGRELQLDLAELFVRRGRIGEAATLLAAVDAPPDATGYTAIRHAYVAATVALARGDIDGAAGHVNAVMASRPDTDQTNSELLIIKAEASVRSGRIEDARAETDRARRVLASTGSPSERMEALAHVALIEQEASRWELSSTTTATDRVRQMLLEADAVLAEMPADAAIPAGVAAWYAIVRAKATSGSARDRWADAASASDVAQFGLLADTARLIHAEELLQNPAGREEAATIVADVGRRAAGSGALALAAAADELATRARLHPVMARQAADVAIPLPTSAFGLTPREIEVLGHLSAGHTNRQIAERLYISEKTASVHVSNVLRKLQVSSRVQAGAVAQRIVRVETR